MAASGGSWKAGKFSAKGGGFAPSAEQVSLRRQLVDAIKDYHRTLKTGTVFIGDTTSAERIATIKRQMRVSGDDFGDDVTISSTSHRLSNIDFNQPTNLRAQTRINTFKRVGWLRDGS